MEPCAPPRLGAQLLAKGLLLSWAWGVSLPMVPLPTHQPHKHQSTEGKPWGHPFHGAASSGVRQEAPITQQEGGARRTYAGRPLLMARLPAVLQPVLWDLGGHSFRAPTFSALPTLGPLLPGQPLLPPALAIASRGCLRSWLSFRPKPSLEPGALSAHWLCGSPGASLAPLGPCSPKACALGPWSTWSPRWAPAPLPPAGLPNQTRS